ncbi:polyketide cyclase [Rhizobium sp. R72]|uniref:SRPBCC family protein n=1 Tax=unclassified Rhizobium TaxID=2613769 RepID=UPI000B52A3F8|nr:MULTISPECIES: SRPBCC family protein [unclassified Rhizobium]OWV93169.1 polyketide cyclase [Rhizobium sp. R72]OWV93396.1 polyketide cyclase [Rhizobium sp. R711]OWV99485.1 polyketide cyclase [Rhizobium sp. R693]
MTEEAQHELVLVREFDAPREKIFKAWTDPVLMKEWFVPRPWSIADAKLDVRPGGSNLIVMRSPEGQEFPNRGVYLEIVENEKIVFTDAFTSSWVPSEKPFFVGIILLEDLGNGRTKYTAKARHWTAADKEQHEQMGFHEGWGKCADQLAELLPRI